MKKRNETDAAFHARVNAAQDRNALGSEKETDCWLCKLVHFTATSGAVMPSCRIAFNRGIGSFSRIPCCAAASPSTC